METRSQGLDSQSKITLICVVLAVLLFFSNMIYGSWVRVSELEQCRSYYIGKHMDESDVDRKCGASKKR